MLQGKLSAPATLGGSLQGRAGLNGSLMTNGRVYPTYDGPTTITPNGEVQVEHTAGTVLLADITINPIPSNYGLITWDGSTLNVS
jgi:hypothetical protein